MTDEQLAWIARVAMTFRGLVFIWRGTTTFPQAVILPGYVWRRGVVS